MRYHDAEIALLLYWKKSPDSDSMWISPSGQEKLLPSFTSDWKYMKLYLLALSQGKSAWPPGSFNLWYDCGIKKWVASINPSSLFCTNFVGHGGTEIEAAACAWIEWKSQDNIWNMPGHEFEKELYWRRRPE